MSGKAVKIAISAVGQEHEYTFAAKANRNVTFQVSSFHVTDRGSAGTVDLDFYQPGSTSSTMSCGFSAGSFCNFSPAVSGQWTVLAAPASDSVGHLTLTFASNVPNVKLVPGKPVTTKVAVEGQQASYTFAAKADKTVKLQVSKVHFISDGLPEAVRLNFYEPGSSHSFASCGFTASGYCSFTTLVGGTYSALLVPGDGAVGSLGLTLG